MIRKRLFVLGLYLVIFVVSIITETLSARTATEIKRLEQDTVIQGIKFPKGTDFGFYESGELKLVVLSQNQVIGGIKWHKENVLYFSKSGSIEDFFLSQSQDKVKKIQEILVRDFPEMKKYPNFLEAMAVIVKNEKLLEYIEKKEVRRYIKERFQTFKEKENLRTASAETLSYFVKYKCNDIYFHEHKSNFLSIPTRKPLERLDYLEKKIFPLSKKIVGRAKNDFEAIEKIACWTRKKIQGICICENRSRTIEILAQGAGIPSRYISGVVKEGKKGHAWIECHLEKKWLAVTSTGYLGKKTLLTREDLKRIGDTVLYARYSNPFYSHLYKGNNSLAYNYRALKVTVDSTRKYFTKSALKKVSELLKNWQKELDYNKRNLIGHQIMKSCLKEVVAKKEGISQNEVLPIYL